LPHPSNEIACSGLLGGARAPGSIPPWAGFGLRLFRAIWLVACAVASPAWPQERAAALHRANARFELPGDLAAKIGAKIWMNETGGDEREITAWNSGEDFMSLGIGHFIWFPAARPERFGESFPAMLEFLRARGVAIPAWLDKHPVPPAPWKDKRDFERNYDAREMVELRQLLKRSIGEQTQFLIQRARLALPKILATLETAREKEHVERQFRRMADASSTLYPLIDYVNFKGEGVLASETVPGKRSGKPEGWGLKHVLLEMSGSERGQAALDEFARAARKVLTRRVANNPADARSKAGWLGRCDTYREPIF
jgi:hypothetical protein